ncbi:MAG TPA: hypothetical protein ENJ09_10980 [Planctomycetes bacterium]|nr:hypothetical protein [Planctomycetota bacterium]
MKEWVEGGELVFVGIAQEQHAARCRLFAQWKGLEMPILWDPFNLTDSEVVPTFVAVDERGIVRSLKPSRETFAEEFLEVDFAALDAERDEESEGGPSMEEAGSRDSACTFKDLHGEPDVYSKLVQGRDLDEAVEELVAASAKDPEDPRLAFRAGVALRLRTDSPLHRPSDFQGAIDHWTRALSLRPNQYIWRRRIQQYGPRMDKPYPFYTWVENAVRDLRARGEEPVELHAALTPAELAEPHRFEPDAGDGPVVAPDPEGRIRRDDQALVSIETAVAFDTSRKQPVASVHLTLRPNASLDAHWNHESGPPVKVWVGTPVPKLLEVPPRSDAPTSSEPLMLTFEVEVPGDRAEFRFPAYALYYVCEGREGTCLYRRQDFTVGIRRP